MQLRIFKLGAIWPRTAAVTATALCILMPALPALSATDNLVITENSLTSLTVSWNSVAITPTLLANDHWQFTLPAFVHLGFGEGSYGSPDGAAITEPGGGTLGPWNNVFTSATLNVPFVSLVDVTSESATTSGYASLVPDNVASLAGTDSSGNSIYLTFHDAGDTSGTTVPDNGSTVALLLMSSIALFGAARWFRAVQAS